MSEQLPKSWAVWRHAEVIEVDRAAELLAEKSEPNPTFFSNGTLAKDLRDLIKGGLVAGRISACQLFGHEEIGGAFLSNESDPADIEAIATYRTTVHVQSLAQWCDAKEIDHPWNDAVSVAGGAKSVTKLTASASDGGDNKPWEDCDQLRLPFYSPLRAAIRWCGLGDKESEIIDRSDSVYVEKGGFPEYPCLLIHSESMRSAMTLGTLPHGRDGRPVKQGEHVAPERRTIAHADLKKWIRAEYPADVRKPHMAWLFDEVERSTHTAITAEAYNALKAEKDGLKTRIEAAEKRADEADAQLAAPLQSDKELDSRERGTMLRMIRVLAAETKMHGRGASVAVQHALEKSGFNGPREKTIREVLKKAAGLTPDK